MPTILSINGTMKLKKNIDMATLTTEINIRNHLQGIKQTSAPKVFEYLLIIPELLSKSISSLYSCFAKQFLARFRCQDMSACCSDSQRLLQNWAAVATVQGMFYCRFIQAIGKNTDEFRLLIKV